MLSGLRAAALHPDVIIATLKAVAHNGGPDHGLQEVLVRIDVLSRRSREGEFLPPA